MFKLLCGRRLTPGLNAQQTQKRNVVTGQHSINFTDGGDGFVLAWEYFRRLFNLSFPACNFFFFVFFFFFFEVEICSRTLFPLFMLGSVHSGSASCDDCGQMFPNKLRVSSFPDRFPHYAWTAA